jgi:hypothetical protein
VDNNFNITASVTGNTTGVDNARLIYLSGGQNISLAEDSSFTGGSFSFSGTFPEAVTSSTQCKVFVKAGATIKQESSSFNCKGTTSVSIDMGGGTAPTTAPAGNTCNLTPTTCSTICAATSYPSSDIPSTVFYKGPDEGLNTKYYYQNNCTASYHTAAQFGGEGGPCKCYQSFTVQIVNNCTDKNSILVSKIWYGAYYADINTLLDYGESTTKGFKACPSSGSVHYNIQGYTQDFAFTVGLTCNGTTVINIEGC